MSKQFSYTTISLTVLLSFLVLLISGCDSPRPTKADRDEVRVAMELRQKAIQTKDIEMYKQVILPGYSDGGVSFDGLIEVMKANFAQNDAIEFTFQRSMVDISMNSARMVGDISYQATGMEKPIIIQERTDFRRINGKWFISGGVKALPL